MKNILNKVFGFKQKDNRYELIQWGSKRSIIKEVKPKGEYMIVDNQLLMNMDERGLIL